MTKRIFSQVVLSFKIILRMKTNVSGLNDAKFQVKIHLQSMICIITFAEMEFLQFVDSDYSFGMFTLLIFDRLEILECSNLQTD
jgi:hypothetical protein